MVADLFISVSLACTKYFFFTAMIWLYRKISYLVPPDKSYFLFFSVRYLGVLFATDNRFFAGDILKIIYLPLIKYFTKAFNF